MNSVQQIKLNQFNSNQKATTLSIARSVASLNNDLAAAISHQTYALLNPDAIIDESMIDLMLVNVDEIAIQFAEVGAKVTDLMAVRTKAMTPEELHAKYPLDLAGYSADLA